MERHHGAVSALKVLMQPDDVQSDHYQSYESAIIDCAEMLERTLRPDDTIGRMGIFEFLIILAPDVQASSSHCEKSIAAIAGRINALWSAAHRVPLALSSATSYPGDEVKDLLNRLDS